jgi:NADPH:quinone reductase-like Zn-dependent oxidoreductase
LQPSPSLIVDVAENTAVKSVFHGNAVDVVIHCPGTGTTIVMEGYDMSRFGQQRPAQCFAVECDAELVTLREVVVAAPERRDCESELKSEKPEEGPFRVVPVAGSNTLAAKVVPCLAPFLQAPLTREPAVAARVDGVTLVVRTEAWGLNFLDVLLAKGVIDLGPDVRWGGEFVGFVEGMYETDENGKRTFVSRCPHSGMRLGDRIVAFNDGSSGWGEFVEVSSLIACVIPATVPAHEAVSVNLAYCTAYLALVEQARVVKGESILVHSAAGGVGLACVNLAKWKQMGPIYGTCSTQEKVDYLTEMGVTKCFNSRDVDEFSGEVLSRGGVDVVVNSLANRAMLKSIQLCNTRCLSLLPLHSSSFLFPPSSLPDPVPLRNSQFLSKIPKYQKCRNPHLRCHFHLPIQGKGSLCGSRETRSIRKHGHSGHALCQRRCCTAFVRVPGCNCLLRLVPPSLPR